MDSLFVFACFLVAISGSWLGGVRWARRHARRIADRAWHEAHRLDNDLLGQALARTRAHDEGKEPADPNELVELRDRLARTHRAVQDWEAACGAADLLLHRFSVFLPWREEDPGTSWALLLADQRVRKALARPGLPMGLKPVPLTERDARVMARVERSLFAVVSEPSPNREGAAGKEGGDAD